ncbi:MAG: signal peptidase I [Clostridia bacterium]|nr:signal peptidase I [Clostridia bacterium]
MRFKEFFKNVIILFLIVVLIEICYSKFVEKEYPVKLFGFSFLCVTTGSMEPTIDSGELIIIREKDKYLENDIVTYLDDDGFLITHRIVNINEGKLITKGDNNNLNDPEVQMENIQGKVILHSKLLGFFVIYILKPLIFIYVIILLIINFKDLKTKERVDTYDEEKTNNEKDCN